MNIVTSVLVLVLVPVANNYKWPSLDYIKNHILLALFLKVCASDNEIENVILKDLSLKFCKLYSRLSYWIQTSWYHQSLLPCRRDGRRSCISPRRCRVWSRWSWSWRSEPGVGPRKLSSGSQYSIRGWKISIHQTAPGQQIRQREEF